MKISIVTANAGADFRYRPTGAASTASSASPPTTVDACTLSCSWSGSRMTWMKVMHPTIATATAHATSPRHHRLAFINEA